VRGRFCTIKRNLIPIAYKKGTPREKNDTGPIFNGRRNTNGLHRPLVREKEKVDDEGVTSTAGNESQAAYTGDDEKRAAFLEILIQDERDSTEGGVV